ncbi:HTH-type transcriptional regulator TtgR [Nocardioides dokdonensis FR1436]|uniref:HTH-type transcriptional regulator TtgR n=1 Tax=Nocardioides dokdonensis FR1436 TaxID=1300347 RepID=A0A1A9GEC9_9ACTN|nr:TetR family transcriptional regulator [Nocardioides dokdonensis]ANH36679.1 HTH-type transcriptional regulator TtgR [Nocardioides dokdonensis FR1436]
MSPDSGAETRRLLVEAASHAFAEHGTTNASLLDITRQAGQRNRGAVHYHFGSRDGLVAAVLDQHATYLGERERALLGRARERPDDLTAAVEAIARPMTELSEASTSGRHYVMILAELVADERTEINPDVRGALERTGGYEVFDEIRARMPDMPEDLLEERILLMTGFLLRAISDRARALGKSEPGRPQLPTEHFVANLLRMVVAMLSAPQE